MAKTPRKAAAKRPASKSPVKPMTTSTGPTGTTKRPEADGEAPPTYRADMGEGLPPQKDSLNPDRAK